MGGLLYLYDCMLTAFMSVVASAPLVWYVDNGAILTFQEPDPAHCILVCPDLVPFRPL